MNELFLLTFAAKSFISLLLSKGSDKIIELIKEKQLIKRAAEKTARNYSGVAPGGEKKVKEDLNSWTSTAEFEHFLLNLGSGTDLNEILEKGFHSFLKDCVYIKNDKAEYVLADLLNNLRDEIYNSDHGRAAMMYRQEIMHSENLDRFDSHDDDLAQIRKDLEALSKPIKESIGPFLEELYESEPITPLIKSGHLAQAIDLLDKRIDRIEQIQKQHPETKTILQEPYQWLLLKLAAILSQKGDQPKAERIFEQAKAIGFTKPERRQQALSVLANLHRVEDFEALLLESNVQETEAAELDLLLLKELWDDIADRIPDDVEEFRPLFLKIVAELNREHSNTSFDAVKLAELMNRLSKFVGEHPLHKVQLAIITIHLLQKVIKEMRETRGLDRKALVKAVYTRTEDAISACEMTDAATNYYQVIIDEALSIYSLLQDEKKLQEIKKKRASEDDESSDLNEALKLGHITDTQYLYFTAVELLENPTDAQLEKALSLLQSALLLTSDYELKVLIIQHLINSNLKLDDIANAEKILKEHIEVSDQYYSLFETQIVKKRDGRSVAIEHLTDAVNKFPLSLFLRRTLVTLLIEQISQEIEKDSNISEIKKLVDATKRQAHVLQQILPTHAHSLIPAHAYFAAHEYTRTITSLDQIVSEQHPPLEAKKLLAQASINLGRFKEAGEQLADLAENTGDPTYAVQAAVYWLNDHNYSRLVGFLESWLEKFPNDPFLLANLAITLIIAYNDYPQNGRKAFNLLARARRYHSDLKDIDLWMSRAASIAGKKQISQRYFNKMLIGRSSITVRHKDDFQSLTTNDENGIDLTVLKFEGDKGLKAFIEWQKERTNALNQLIRADVISYGDLFKKIGKPWEHWIQWTYLAEKQFKKHPDILAIKAPWPFTKSKTSATKGLLLDITTLLTLSILPEPDRLIRAVNTSGHRPYILSNDIELLRKAIESPEEYLFDVIKLPYDELIETLRRYSLINSYTDKQTKHYLNVVDDSLNEQLGNNAYDYGLACTLNGAVFISDPQDTTNYTLEANETSIATSASLLHTLVEEGIIGMDAANKAAVDIDRFQDWENAIVIEVPKNVVISAFALPYWFKSGLLTCDDENWLRNIEGWPRIHIGPFACKHLNEMEVQVKIQQIKKEAASSFYSLLMELIAQNIVEVLSIENYKLPNDGLDPRLYEIWPHLTSLLHISHRHNLDIWSDDRVIGYFLWPFGHPLDIKQLNLEVRRIREAYPNVNLLTTEDALEDLNNEDQIETQCAEKLGYKLWNLGYQPLRYRLALSYLLHNFAYKAGSLKYQPLLQVLNTLLSGHLSANTENDTDVKIVFNQKALQSLILFSRLPDLIQLIWHSPAERSLDERKALANEFLKLGLDHFDDYRDRSQDVITNFWVSLLSRMASLITNTNNGSNVSNKIDEEYAVRFSQALVWYTDSLERHTSGKDLEPIVRGIEDFIIQYLVSVMSKMRPRIRDEVGKKEERLSYNEIESRVMANLVIGLKPYLFPFFSSRLLNHFDSLLRRILGVLGNDEDDFKVFLEIPVTDQQIKLVLDEGEIEKHSFNIIDDILRGYSHAIELIRADLVMDYIWHRPVPEESKKKHSDLPDTHQVFVKHSLFTLLFRDEIIGYAPIIDNVVYFLRLYDPILCNQLFSLKNDLISENKSVRKKARKRLAFAILDSTYFELERDLFHGINHIRQLETDELERYLAPSISQVPTEDQNPYVMAKGNQEYPIATLIDLDVLITSPKILYERSNAEANLLLNPTDEKPSLLKTGQFLLNLTTEIYSPFQLAYYILTILSIVTNQNDDQAKLTFKFKGKEWTIRSWLNTFLKQLLHYSSGSSQNGTEEVRLPWRSPELKAAYVCMLRLSTYATGAQHNIESWKKEFGQDEEVVKNWINGMFILTERMFPLIVGSQKNDNKLQMVCEDIVRRLNLNYDQPSNFIDRFNPFILGPHLLDLEVSAILHVLNIYIQYNSTPEKALDLNSLHELVKPWTEGEQSESEKIYVQQKEHSLDTLGLKMSLSPCEAAISLLDLIEKIM